MFKEEMILRRPLDLTFKVPCVIIEKCLRSMTNQRWDNERNAWRLPFKVCHHAKEGLWRCSRKLFFIEEAELCSGPEPGREGRVRFKRVRDGWRVSEAPGGGVTWNRRQGSGWKSFCDRDVIPGGCRSSCDGKWEKMHRKMPNGLHFIWSWTQIHFLNMGAGSGPEDVAWRTDQTGMMWKEVGGKDEQQWKRVSVGVKF